MSSCSNNLRKFPTPNCCCCQLKGYNYYPSDATSLLAISKLCKPPAAVKALDGRCTAKENYSVENSVIDP